MTIAEQSIIESWFETVYANETSWEANYKYIDEVRGKVGQFNKSLLERFGYGLNVLDYVAHLIDSKNLRMKYVPLLSIPLREDERIERDSLLASQFVEVICERMDDYCVPSIMCSNIQYYVEYYEKLTPLTKHLVGLPSDSRYVKKSLYSEYYHVDSDQIYPSVYVVVDLRT